MHTGNENVLERNHETPAAKRKRKTNLELKAYDLPALAGNDGLRLVVTVRGPTWDALLRRDGNLCLGNIGGKGSNWAMARDSVLLQKWWAIALREHCANIIIDTGANVLDTWDLCGDGC